MTRILFVCHGNICRSPMAEMVLREMVRRSGMDGRVEAASCAVSREEIGHPVYPPARAVLQQHGVPCGAHRARQVTKEDYRQYDLLVVMDESNRTHLAQVIGADTEGKVRSLMSFAGRQGGVADPWYTGDFDTAYRDIVAGCAGLLHSLFPDMEIHSRNFE